MSAVTVRDIPCEIELRDSCNCCHFWYSKCCIRSSTVIYINKDYEAEKFNRSKSKDHICDYDKSIMRLNEYVEGIRHYMTSDEVFSFQDRRVVLYEDIRRINLRIRQLQRTNL